MGNHFKFLFICCLVFLLGSSAFSRILYVPFDYSTVQLGIDNALEGDTVLLRQGTYYENIDFSGKNICVASYYILTGNNSDITSTFIDGTDSGPVVTFSGGEDSTAILKGLVIRNGSGLKEENYNHTMTYIYGGGIYCNNASPTIENNIITQNNIFISTGTCQAYGAGIYCDSSYARIINNTISNNQAYRSNEQGSIMAIGGGIFTFNSNNLIKGNKVFSNIAKMGGGIAVLESQVNIEDNEIYQNEVFSVAIGGGILCSGSDDEPYRILIRNNIIKENIGINGTGITCMGTSALIENNTIYKNNETAIACGLGRDTLINNTICYNSGAALDVSNNAYPILFNNILWDNNNYGNEIRTSTGSPTVSCCLVMDGWEGDGNIDANPQFCDLENDNYNINSHSPCLPENNSCGVLIGAGQETCDLLCGDANNDDHVNLADVTYLIIYYFQRGSAPYNSDMADLNNNGYVDLADIIFLILYINDTEPEPWCIMYSLVTS